MLRVKCKGGCGKTRETPTLNKTHSEKGHSTVPPWTCEECARKIAGRKAGVVVKEAKKDPGFRLIPGKQRTVTPKPPAEKAVSPPTPPATIEPAAVPEASGETGEPSATASA
jgi:hypothetical protein